MWDSSDILKTLGILFIIVMVWYIVFIIFQENKRFLLSVVSSEENNSIKMSNLINKILPDVKEGMSDAGKGEYEKAIKAIGEMNKDFESGHYEINKDPDADQSKLHPELVLKRLETNLKYFKLLAGLYAMQGPRLLEKVVHPTEGPAIDRELSSVLNIIKCCKVGISILKESKGEAENEGAGGGGGGMFS